MRFFSKQLQVEVLRHIARWANVTVRFKQMDSIRALERVRNGASGQFIEQQVDGVRLPAGIIKGVMVQHEQFVWMCESERACQFHAVARVALRRQSKENAEGKKRK